MENNNNPSSEKQTFHDVCVPVNSLEENKITLKKKIYQVGLYTLIDTPYNEEIVAQAAINPGFKINFYLFFDDAYTMDDLLEFTDDIILSDYEEYLMDKYSECLKVGDLK
jgi:hypothetical protein